MCKQTTVNVSFADLAREEYDTRRIVAVREAPDGEDSPRARVHQRSQENGRRRQAPRRKNQSHDQGSGQLNTRFFEKFFICFVDFSTNHQQENGKEVS